MLDEHELLRLPEMTARYQRALGQVLFACEALPSVLALKALERATLDQQERCCREADKERSAQRTRDVV